MTPYAHTDPVMGIMARGFAVHKATTNPQKPIVVIGIWLWMVPMLFTGIGLTVLGVGALIAELHRGSLWGLFGLPVAVLGVAFMWIASVILFRTTSSFLGHRRARGQFGEDSGEADYDDVDRAECLECRHLFDADVERCPRCGWTYQ
jgi:hypothetical protein